MACTSDILRLALLFAVGLSACTPTPTTPEQAALECEERARAAQSPTGSVTVGTGSDGGFGRVEIGVSADLLAGRDPVEVYEECVFDRTGAAPIRPPRLR